MPGRAGLLAAPALRTRLVCCSLRRPYSHFDSTARLARTSANSVSKAALRFCPFRTALRSRALSLDRDRMAALCRRERRSALPSSVDSSHSRLDRRCPFARSRPSCPRRASRRVLDTHTARRSRAFSSRASASAMRNDTAGLRRLGSTRAAASRSVSRCTSWCRKIASFAARRIALTSSRASANFSRLAWNCTFKEPSSARAATSAHRHSAARASAASARATSRSWRKRHAGTSSARVSSGSEAASSTRPIGVSPLPISSARMAMHATIAEYRSCYQTPKEAFSPVQGRQDSNQPSNLDDEKSSTMSTHPPRTERLRIDRAAEPQVKARRPRSKSLRSSCLPFCQGAAAGSGT